MKNTTTDTHDRFLLSDVPWSETPSYPVKDINALASFYLDKGVDGRVWCDHGRIFELADRLERWGLLYWQHTYRGGELVGTDEELAEAFRLFCESM